MTRNLAQGQQTSTHCPRCKTGFVIIHRHDLHHPLTCIAQCSKCYRGEGDELLQWTNRTEG